MPTISQVKAAGDPTCRTGTGVRLYLNTLTPTFSAYVGDLDAQNVRLQVEITPVGGSARPLLESTNGARNTVHAVTVPAGQALVVNTVYTYRVRALDLTSTGAAVDYSPWTTPCEIQYDATTLDSAPQITDVPTVDVDGELWPVLKFGRGNLVTFRPDPADAGEVVRYSYGFSADRVGDSSVSVPAGLDGSATVTITPWEVDGTNAPASSSTLYVRAFTGSGTLASSKMASMDLFFDYLDMIDGNGVLVPPAAKPDDVNGDGLADLSGFRDLGTGKGMFYSYSGKSDGSTLEPISLMTTNAYTDADTRTVQGDFNGDGKTDFAAFKSISTSSTTVSLLRSTGTVPYADVLADVQVKALALNLANMKIMAGDVNADGKDDLAFGYLNTTTNWNIKVMLASVDGHGTVTPHDDEVLFANPVDWLAVSPGSNLNNAQLVMGQFDKVPGADIMEFFDHGSCRTGGFLHKNLGTTFSAGQVVWDSNTTGAWCAASARYTVGRYATGAYGLDGIVATYDPGSCRMNVYTFTPKHVAPNDTWTMEGPTLRFDSGPSVELFCWNWTEPELRDLSGDGKDDLLLTYRCCGAFQQRVWQLDSNGTGFDAPVLKWQGALGPAGTGSLKYNGTTHYQFVAKHSGMCLAVNGSPIDGTALVQQPCARNLLDQRFVLEQRGAGHVRLHPQHITSKCIIYDVVGAGSPIIQKSCSATGSKESFQLDYVSGFTNDPANPLPTDVAVKIVSNTTASRCVSVQGASMAAAAATVQDACQPPGYGSQTYYLRALPAQQPSMTARWTMGESGGTTLADGTGNTATAKIAGSGVVGSGVLTLNGTSQYASTTGGAVHTGMSYTVSAWAKLDVGARSQTILSQEGATNYSFALRQNVNGKWNFTVLSNANSSVFTSYIASSTAVAPLNTWVHLTGVFDQATGQARLYVNGVLEGTATGVTAGSSGPVFIGATKINGARAEYFDGQIDDVRMWNYVLTPTEITAAAAARS
ncbi:hypothetical protein Cme02nite_65470 [Catellatospora methionotrophica]|uniref:LamG-like jellyroll fold domain-containing protein n=1 Tax=Catellatospora methionotrophica TaxID=121620 RepID=A0A8J3LH81_9ACTN|nr:hypothetical protein Cme02nite_65470 [Catellatospora methionotrophica]